MFNYHNHFYANGHLSAVISSGGVVQSDAYPNYSEYFVGAEQPCAMQKLVHFNSYPESNASCCSDEFDEQYFPTHAQLRGDRSISCSVQYPQYYHLDLAAVSDNFTRQLDSPPVARNFTQQLNSPPVTGRGHPLAREECCYSHSLTLSDEPVSALGCQLNVHALSSSYEIASRECEKRLRHLDRRSHLLKTKSGDRRSRLNSKDSTGSEKKKKRYRPFAAIRERERLAVMNSALKELKNCLPLDNHEQKLSKKQILVAAAIYIKRLSETLDRHHKSNSRTEEETVNLDKHNYIAASQ